MYKPPYAINLQTAPAEKLMVGLQGKTKTGKTTSALTFPNPIVADFDGNLTGHLGRDIIVVPFYKKEWCLANQAKWKVKANTGINANVINRRDLLQVWLSEEASKFSAEQTLIVDSWTTLQDSFDIQTDLEPVYTKQGSIDEFAFWARKVDYAQKVLNTLKELSCQVVVTFHEQPQMDKEKNITGKIEPLMQGKFVNKIALYFSDFFRCHVIQQRGPDNKPLFEKDGKTPVVDYFWQTKPDGTADCGSRLRDIPMFVEQNYRIFEKYKTQNTITA
jgi:hypothetical protein